VQATAEWLIEPRRDGLAAPATVGAWLIEPRRDGLAVQATAGARLIARRRDGLAVQATAGAVADRGVEVGPMTQCALRAAVRSACHWRHCLMPPSSAVSMP
jgi:hypothetical protein